MKEATGEGSMSIITIVVIVGLAAAAAAIVLTMVTKANTATNSMDTGAVHYCSKNTTYNNTTKTCN